MSIQKDFQPRHKKIEPWKNPVKYCMVCADVLRPGEHKACKRCKTQQDKYAEPRMGFLS